MKKIIILTSIFSVFIISAFTVADIWANDAKTSTVKFELPGHQGSFGNLTTNINFDKADLSQSKITAGIDVKTIKAGDVKLETHLLSPDFFDAEKFPKITFSSDEIKTTETGFLAKGKLTMKDSTKAIELPFTFLEVDKTNATFSGTMTVNAADYGVMKKKADKPNNDKVTIYLVVPVRK